MRRTAEIEKVLDILQIATQMLGTARTELSNSTVQNNITGPYTDGYLDGMDFSIKLMNGLAEQIRNRA